MENRNQSLAAVTGLSPYSGEWTKQTAAHLLRRTVFGPSFEEIERATGDGLSNSLSRLLEYLPPPPPPIVHQAGSEPAVSLGSTWVYSPHPPNGGQYRGESLISWYFLNLMKSSTNIQHKMVLFWVNYFGMSDISDHRSMYKSIRLFQELSTGNFRSMIERITIDPSMLIFLNGNINGKGNPNENYARELLELFTIQKGTQVAPGDYTNYTEQDIAEIARALTGWQNYPFVFSNDNTPVDSFFNEEEHDTGTKTLSHRFGNAVITNAGANEYKQVINIILQQQETARAFCRELYRFFVFYEIPPEVEQEVISPLADILRNSNYEIKPVLESLFNSEHFYDTATNGAMIKNPQDFIGGIYRPFNEFAHIDFPSISLRYGASNLFNNWCRDLGMSILSAPTVSGWMAYYQAPNYYRSWISTSTIQRRYELVKKFMSPYYHISNFRLPVDWRGFLARFSNPIDVNQLLDDIVVTFLPRKISPMQLAGLKEALLGQLGDDEWIVQYSNYISNPNDSSIANTFEQRLYRLFIKLFGLPEFHLQ